MFIRFLIYYISNAGACSMGMGYLPYWMMYQCLMATFLFYLAHWQTYVTGKYCLSLSLLEKKILYKYLLLKLLLSLIHFNAKMFKKYVLNPWCYIISIYLSKNGKNCTMKIEKTIPNNSTTMQIQKSITIVLATIWGQNCHYFH